jgi:hypothetical protein
MRKKNFVLAILSLPFLLWADKAVIEPPAEPDFEPWFTGPLLAPAAIPIPVGHINIEPYIYATARTAFYNRDWNAISRDTFWNINFQSLVEFGLTSFMDFEFAPSFSYNFTEGAGAWALNDIEILVNFQIFNFQFAELNSWNTALKLALTQTFPTGKYQNLDPKKKFTDQGGQGSWQTTVGLVWGNQVHVTGHQFFNSRFSVAYTYLTSVDVKGFNSYGGGTGTQGTVHPGRSFQIDLGLEYSLTQHWVIATDIVGIWQGSSSFSGIEGDIMLGTILSPAQTGLGSSAQFSLAPAIEYNWNENIGLIAGVWFTVAGRETSQFASGVVAFNYYH